MGFVTAFSNFSKGLFGSCGELTPFGQSSGALWKLDRFWQNIHISFGTCVRALLAIQLRARNVVGNERDRGDPAEVSTVRSFVPVRGCTASSYAQGTLSGTSSIWTNERVPSTVPTERSLVQAKVHCFLQTCGGLCVQSHDSTAFTMEDARFTRLLSLHVRVLLACWTRARQASTKRRLPSLFPSSISHLHQTAANLPHYTCR